MRGLMLQLFGYSFRRHLDGFNRVIRCNATLRTLRRCCQGVVQPALRRRHRWIFGRPAHRLCRPRPFGRLARDDSGSVLVLTLVSMVAILGFSALAIDLGVLMSEQQRMQAAADAGAISGAQELLQGAQPAASTAVQYAEENFGQAEYTATANTTDNTVKVVATEATSLWFARVLGIQHGTVTTQSTAEIGVLTSGTGMVPLAVTQDELQFGQEEYLSADAGDGLTGNYGFLDFGGAGSTFEQYLATGYDGQLYVGEQIDTLTGMRAGQVAPGIQQRLGSSAGIPACNSIETATDDCSTVMVVPVVNTLDVSGNKPVTIIGFAAFFLDGLTGAGGHEEITGQFMHMVTKGSVGSGTNFGTYTIKLIH